MSASDISLAGNNSDTSSLLPLDSCAKGNNNVICEAVHCTTKAVLLIRVKAGQNYIQLNLCEAHKDICDQYSEVVLQYTDQ
jgi:hypothetical protein